MIYFDHNATSPLCQPAREGWLSAIEKFPANPASAHRLGARADAALEEARAGAAELLKCSPLDVVWTSGATEANNSVLYHASLDGSGEVWVSAIEHPSVLAPVRHYFRDRFELIPVTRAGVIDLNWLADHLKTRRPALVFVMAANNETGVLQPWEQALRLCRERDVRFACDAAQWVGKKPARGLGECDYATGCAHKFGGPVGVGFMKVPSGFKPLLRGGAQEDGRRSGTQNVAGVLSMMAAWHHRENQLKAGEDLTRERWRNSFINAFDSKVAEVECLGLDAPRLWNTATILLPKLLDCRRRWVVQLDKSGFAASTGSACANGQEKPSHVITAMGYAPGEGDRVVRFSASWETQESDWKALGDAVASLAQALGATPEASATV